ncbi:hypothetical protein FALCPG4_018139 [Fusarium falciforme]
MSQNIYDRPDFFQACSEQIDRSSNADLAIDPAWTRLRPLLPDSVDGLDILDLGCGSGWFCRWARNAGARSVLGIDISEKMLAKARWLTDGRYTGIEYLRADLDSLQLPEEDTGKFDLVFSSLALHYLTNLSGLIALVNRVLKPGALFIFNVEHPIYTAPHNPRVIDDPATGEKCWAFNGYYKEGERVVDWLVPGVRKQHRTFTGYVNLFLGAGFDIVGFLEWLPTEEELLSGKVAEIEKLRPLFWTVSIRKR